MTHNLLGRRFGRLVVIEKSGAPRLLKRLLWTCRCDCGRSADIYSDRLLSGHTKSCGCLWRDAVVTSNAQNKRTHGQTLTRVYRIWVNIRYRCYNSSSSLYPLYGGRGIAMSDEWRTSFEAFARDMGPRPEGRASVERIDVNGPYSADNCRWATPKDQARNRRNTAFVERDGQVIDAASLAEQMGLSYSTVAHRARRGSHGLRRVTSGPSPHILELCPGQDEQDG